MAGTKGGTNEDTGNNKINPFEQPPILQALFKHINQLPVEDLIQCRLVNKQWYNETLSTFRSNATLKLKFGKRGILSNSSRLTLVGEFLDLWEAEEWGSCPFRKLSLQGLTYFWEFRAGSGYVKQVRFLELVGSHVTSLTIEDKLRAWNSNDVQEIKCLISQVFPKLQFLKINGYGGLHDGYFDDKFEVLAYRELDFGVHGHLKSLDLPSCSYRSLMDLLTHFHKVENLSLHMMKNYKNGQEQYRQILDVIIKIRAGDPTKLPLKNFDVEFGFKLGHGTASSIALLRLHEQHNIPLQRLKIWFYPEEEMDPHFKYVIPEILQYHFSTLKYLAFDGDGRHGLFNSFPFGFNLEKLEELVILSPGFSDNLNYLEYIPNLRVLVIQKRFVDQTTQSVSDKLFSNSSQLEIGDWTLPSLTELRFELPLSVCNLGKLMKWMPNVEHLIGLELDDVKFSMICENENWRNLKELWDWGQQLTDEGVIGIGNGVEAVGDEETRSGTNISKLQNLTSFSSFSLHLTSACLLDEFLKLANLKELTLGEFRLDKDAINELKRSF